MDTASINHRIRTGKVNEFKNTERTLFAATGPDAGNSPVICHYNFTGFNIPYKPGADSIQSAAFTGEYNALSQLADTERTESHGITGSNQLARTGNHQRIGALQFLHGLLHCLFNTGRDKTLPCNGMGNYFCIRCAIENCAVQFIFPAQFSRVGQIAVVGKSHISLPVTDQKRLGIFHYLTACCGIPAMSDSDLSRSHGFQYFPGKYAADQSQILMAGDHTLIVDSDAAALLSPVLQCIQTMITGRYNICSIRAVYAEYTTFFMQFGFPAICHAHSPIKRFITS